jgi:nucleoside-diphosphate-sugar epimerase
MQRILLFGASGAVGGFLLPLLQDHYDVLPVSRALRPGWLRGNLNDAGGAWPDAAIVISLGPLDAFARWLERQAATPRRVIALSSMSAESKYISPDPAEHALAERLRDAEKRVFAYASARGSAATIFRPTLIYGAGTDRSLAPIARFARRWRVLPVPVGADGQRQPVHAADLAKACAAVIACPAAYGKTYELGGGERLRFDALLWRMRETLPGFVLPLPLPRLLLQGVARLWRRAPFSTAAIARLHQPLVADNSAATRDFGYAPVAFQVRDVLPR